MKIDSISQLGIVLRETRVALDMPLADLAGILGTSQTLLRRQEQGKATVALEKLLATMQELGIELHVKPPPVGAWDSSGADAGSKRRARP